MTECRETNPVFGKTLGVLGHAELFEPVRNLLHWRPPPNLTLSVSERHRAKSITTANNCSARTGSGRTLMKSAIYELFLRDFAASWAHIIGGWHMIPKPEQISRWASQEAAIKAEINEAKNTLDLMRMATAIARLDALHAEMEATSKPEEAGD